MSRLDTADAQELDSLMKDFPEWRSQHPELYQQLYPPRYSKICGKPREATSSGAALRGGRTTEAPESDYQSAYRASRNPRPRSTKRPPPSPRDPHPPAMEFDTNQRSDYQAKDLTVRADPFKPQQSQSNYDAKEQPFDGVSNYRKDFPGHKPLPSVLRLSQSDVTKDHMTNSKDAVFHGQTTTTEHYKGLRSRPAVAFRELPTFTGSVLYPDKTHQMETTNSATFQGKLAPKPLQAKMAKGTLKVEGETNFSTTSGMTFTEFKDAKRAERIVHKSSDLKSRSQFETMTQSRRDFPEYLGGQPRPACAVEPAVASIDLKFDDRVAFDTEQRSQFVGVDTKTHPVTRMKSDSAVYRPPSVKFETLTNQKLDFRPFDVQDACAPPSKGPQGSMRGQNLPKMESTTTTNNFYQKWNVQPRVRHGDLHEGHKYTPPTSKFDAMTTTGATFLGQSTDVPQAFKPRDAAIDMEGRREFGTVYRTAFDTPVAAQRLSKSQGQKLLQELRMRKDTRHPVGAA